MKKSNPLFIISLLILLISALSSNGQKLSVNASSGGHHENSNLSIDFTLGEPVIKTLQNNELILTQGFHQPTLVITEINAQENLNFQIDAYPNPVSDFLQLVVSKIPPLGSIYQIYNMNGRLLEVKKVTDKNTSISFQHYVSATYFLRIVGEDQTLKTFKIIKK